MSAFLCVLLCCAAWGLFFVSRPGWKGHRRARNAPSSSWLRSTKPAVEALPRLVRQVAALLSAGIAGPVLWGALSQVLVVERRLTRQVDRQRTYPLEGEGSHPNGVRAAPGTTFDDATLVLVQAIERASGLGLPTAQAVRSACQTLGTHSKLHRTGKLTPTQQRVWLDIAACFEVCEISGAPVAAVLERLATTLEAEQDAAALRETALAGPRATVRLLNCLPFLGLGLGILMGVDPFAVFLGGPLGWTLLAVGLVLVCAGKAWSARLIASAARSPAASAAHSGKLSPGRSKHFSAIRRW